MGGFDGQGGLLVLEFVTPPAQWLLGLCRVLTAALTLIAGAAHGQGNGSAGHLQFFPDSLIYPHYIADPQRLAFALVGQGYLDRDIPSASGDRALLKAGGRAGVLRIQRPAGRVWQLDVEGGFKAQFDNSQSQDSVGWDGHYGLVFAAALPDGTALKLAIRHTSSHLGDEYIETTGRTRLDYTREEYGLGFSRPFGNNHANYYFEAGWTGYTGNEEMQRTGRLQGGFNLARPKRFAWGGGWYFALDLTSFEERDWRLNRSVQFGLLLPSTNHAWRAGMEIYRGGSPLGEFFQHTESHVGLGLWVDI